MKNNRLFLLLAAVTVLAAGCEKTDTTEDVRDTVPVESVSLDESISGGAELTAGGTLSIADLVTVLPEDATDRTVSYQSSDETVATVSEEGLVTALKAGAVTISVTAGDKTVKFILTVKAATVEIVSITASETSLAYELSEVSGPVDLMQYITINPQNYTGDVIFESSDGGVADVDARGQMTIKGEGECTVTVAAENNAEINAVITVTVTPGQVTGDYDRSEWSMTCSQNPLPELSDRNNSLTAMLDGDASTVFCITRPGKNTGGINLSTVDKETYQIDFTIDMGAVQKVNYFRLDHLSDKGTDLGTRMAGFTEILGSTNGTEFSSIVKNINFAEHSRVLVNTSTENIAIPLTECRYIKFVMVGTGCYDPGVDSDGNDTDKGNSAQIKEIYMGYDPETVE